MINISFKISNLYIIYDIYIYIYLHNTVVIIQNMLNTLNVHTDEFNDPFKYFCLKIMLSNLRVYIYIYNISVILS